MQRILADIINSSFTTSVGKNQNQNPEPVALVVIFRTRLDHDREEGYRYADLAIYGAENYVQVYGRDRWDVVSLGDLEYNEEGEGFIKADAKGYVSGESEWTKFADHDSCWREGTYEFLDAYKDQITAYCETVAVPVKNLNLPEKG